jgi:hypothetical protein
VCGMERAVPNLRHNFSGETEENNEKTYQYERYPSRYSNQESPE